MACSTVGFKDSSQKNQLKAEKNQLKAEEVVSLPAKMKLMIMSLRNWGELSWLLINLESKSSSSNLLSLGSLGQDKNQPGESLDSDIVNDEMPERFGIELVTGCFPLNLPELAIRVEDSLAQKVLEKQTEAVAFGVVVEVGLENMLHVQRVGADYAMDFAWTKKHGCVGRTLA
ncbi:chitin synthase 1 [Corchorus capsularis]|uniref:Chitin synthase 1 n=1 Tax=Corchorus capsularis TaxID=210143 RepID=A0A1R3HZZ2_COCAP|nr:chitin synthase 1 [Corchorus capsularis]